MMVMLMHRNGNRTAQHFSDNVLSVSATKHLINFKRLSVGNTANILKLFYV